MGRRPHSDLSVLSVAIEPSIPIFVSYFWNSLIKHQSSLIVQQHDLKLFPSHLLYGGNRGPTFFVGQEVDKEVDQ